MLQYLIVFVVVASAALYSGWSLMPAGLRRAAAARLAGAASRFGVAEAAARELQAKLSTDGGCSDCNRCGACATPTAGKPAGSAPEMAVVAMPKRGVHRVTG